MSLCICGLSAFSYTLKGLFVMEALFSCCGKQGCTCAVMSVGYGSSGQVVCLGIALVALVGYAGLCVTNVVEDVCLSAVDAVRSAGCGR